MKKQEQRMVMFAVLGSIVIRQIFEVVIIAMVPGFEQLPVMIRFILSLVIAVVTYFAIIILLKKSV